MLHRHLLFVISSLGVISLFHRAVFAADLPIQAGTATFGRLTAQDGSDPRLDVSFTNKSPDDVAISRADITCGCMSALLERPVNLRPNDNVKIHVTLHREKMVRGKVAYNLTLSNEKKVVGATPVSYEFDPPIQAQPSSICLAEVSGKVAVRLNVYNGSKDPPKISVSDSLINASVVRVADSPSEYDLTVSLLPSHPVGSFQATISATLSDGQKVILPVIGEVSPPVELKPKVLLLGTLPSTQPTDRDVLLASDVPFHVESIEASQAAITVSPKQYVNGGKGYHVIVDPVGTKGLIRGTIVFHFDQPSKFDLKLDLIGETGGK